MHKATKLAIVCAVFTLSIFAPRTGYALQRAPDAPTVIVLSGHPEPPIKLATSRDGITQGKSRMYVVLEGHSDPPLSARFTTPTVRPSTQSRILGLGLNHFGCTFLITWGATELSQLLDNAQSR